MQPTTSFPLLVFFLLPTIVFGLPTSVSSKSDMQSEPEALAAILNLVRPQGTDVVEAHPAAETASWSPSKQKFASSRGDEEPPRR